MNQATSLMQRFLFSCAIALIFPAAHADITVEETMSVSGAGLMKMASMTGRTVTAISGRRARTDSDLQFESGMVRAFSGGAGQSTEIVLLDEDKIYDLNNKKKTYKELTFADRRAVMQTAMEKMQEAQASQQQATSGVDESKCEWLPPKSEVKKTGEKTTIGGYQADRVIVTATQTCKIKDSDEACEFGLSLDQWLTPGFEASEEKLAYHRAYAEKLGLTSASSRDFAERAQTMFGRYRDLLAEVGKKSRDLKGYPAKASFALGVGGPQCKTIQETQAAGGPAAPPNIGGAIGGAIGGLFGKKKEQTPPPAPTTPPPATPNGLMSLMTVSTELISVNRNAVSPDAFVVPAGYKKSKD